MSKKVVLGVLCGGALCFVTGFSTGYVAGIVHPPQALAVKAFQQPYGAQLYGAPAAALPPQPMPPQPMPSAPPVQPPYAPSPTPIKASALSNPEIGRKVMTEVAKLHGVLIGADGKKVDESQVVTIFFDPRCPFCHSLFRTISGKIPVKWVPIPVLAGTDAGISSSAFILSAKGEAEASRAIETAFSYVGEGSVAHTPDDTQKWLAGINPTDQQKKDLQESVSAFVAIHKAPGSDPTFGVPSVLVPMADGSVTMHDGYNPGDENKIIADYRRGR